MFLISEPNIKIIEGFIQSQQNSPFSYSEIGLTRNLVTPNGYNIDHNRIQIGTGREAFESAQQALENWKMFDTGWTKIHLENTPIKKNEIVAVVINHLGFWSINAAKIVYVFEESGEEVEKFGFAYGTLIGHGEKGEERFSVEYHKSDESVWYDLFAFSQPNHWMAQIGYPISRFLQKQFAKDSKQAMLNAVKT